MSNTLTAYGIFKLGLAGFQIERVPSLIKRVHRMSIIRYIALASVERELRRPVVGTIYVRGLHRYVQKCDI